MQGANHQWDRLRALSQSYRSASGRNVAWELRNRFRGPSGACARGRPTVRKEPREPISLGEASRLVTVLAVVISGHLGLWMLMLRPGIFDRDTTPVLSNRLQVLKLRFFPPPQPSSAHPRLPAYLLIAPAVHGRKTLPARSSKPLAVQQTAPASTPPSAARITSALGLETSEKNASRDGGFHERLHRATHSYSVRGLPGSDTPSAPGIRLVDPMHQGIGALMRTAQRAFGIENRHCINVDVWRHLTPQELSARHISPGDVDKVDQKYDCNEPPGLHF